MPRSITPHDPLTRPRTVARSVLEMAAEMLWPTRCAICDQPGTLLCSDCLHALRWADHCFTCRACGAPYGGRICTECNSFSLASAGRTSLPVEGMAHALILDERSRRIITTYKDKGERRLADPITDMMLRQIDPDWLDGAGTTTFIPDTLGAVRRRGFDHGAELARMLSHKLGSEMIEAFERPESTDQRRLGRTERFRNMEEVLHVRETAALSPTMLLIDDICTTGSTLFAAADALKRAGVATVFAVTFARAVD